MLRAIRKALLGLALAALVFFAVRALYRALASPETKIRWRIEEMVEGFNRMRSQPVLDGIDRKFVDRVAEVTRDDVRSILAWMYLNELDEKGRFLWSAELDPEQTTIEVAPDEHSANVACRVQFFRRRGDEPVLNWDARVAGTFALGDDGWQWAAVTSANHDERRRP